MINRWKEVLTRRRVCLKCCDDSRFRNLVWTTVLHVDCCEQQDVALLCHARCDSLHDLAIDGLLVVGYQILIQQLLDLVRAQHPANVLNDLNVVQGSLLQLEQLGSLHQMLKLQRALGHVMRFAPLFDTSDVVVDLQASLP